VSYSAASLRWAAEQADQFFARRKYVPALEEIAEVQRQTAARPVDPFMPDRAICELAERRAVLMSERINGLTEPMTPERMREWLSEQVEAMNARPLPEFKCGKAFAEQLAPMLKRVQCRLYWRRQLRRAVVLAREALAMQRGEVCARRRQVYITDDTARRHGERAAANAAMLEATELEDATGQVITLAQASAATTASPAIRRGELMTRVRGCEEWADAAGLVGLFTTNTTPSRYHPQRMTGGANPRHDGSTPRQAQEWLRKTWAKARSALQRKGVDFFGFRVAEPHHDGCPHWHMLLWTKPGHLSELRDTMRAYWLKDAGEEPGAQEYRFHAEDMKRGGATGYIAKYITKGIDDVGALEAEGHTDQRAGEQAELFGAGANRVRAWASAHGIRQFQAIGQPPVTVWRELRRITDEAAAGASDAIKAARVAVHRDGERRADWRAYMDAQGGAMKGRANRIRLVVDTTEREGRYGPAEGQRPIGVEDARRPGEWVLSDRREWRPKGTWSEEARAPRRRLVGLLVPVAPRAAGAPWTRLNNCTQGRGARDLIAGLMARDPSNHEWAGGPQQEIPSWTPPPPPPSARPRPSPTMLRSFWKTVV